MELYDVVCDVMWFDLISCGVQKRGERCQVEGRDVMRNIGIQSDNMK
jgi:hypothetical protein